MSGRNDLNRVVLEHCIDVQDWHTFGYGLCDKQPIKWIFMMQRQCLQTENMHGFDRQELNLIVILLFTNDLL